MAEQAKRVLVVEDEEAMARFVAGTLAARGYAITMARNGIDAMRLVDDGLCDPALVLLDLDLPRMAGEQVLHELRHRSSSAHTPIIVLSGHTETERKVTCLERGANDYVVKPVAGPELVARVASQLRVARVADRWRRGAVVDSLTGLLNRRGLLEGLTVELPRCKRQDDDLAVIFFDVNGFKQLNDRFGHAYGDNVLGMLAETMKASVRCSDLAARWGGDEFVAVCPGLNRCGAQRVIREIRWRSSQLIKAPGFGIAAGVCCVSEVAAPQRGVDALIDRADSDMYRNKGRSSGVGFAAGSGTWRRKP